MEKDRIVHILPGSSIYTTAYIDYMEKKMLDFIHTFIILPGTLKIEKSELYNKNIIRLENKDIINVNTKKNFEEADKIIYSGVFDLEILFKFSDDILKKLYLQFWGGDFYRYRNIKFFSKLNLVKIKFHRYIKRCSGIINLIENDYEEFCEIFPNDLKHFVGIVPEPELKIDYEKCLNKKNNSRKIIIGNSATKENCHVEVFEKLKHLKNENIEIICPLSYGDNIYAKEIIKIGKSIFDDKFIPLTDYMCFQDYMKILSTCEVGIFNNNRQQAMGNINAMFRMGKKIYLRKETSMWKSYVKSDLKCHLVDELDNIKCDDLFKFEINDKFENYKKMINRDKNFEKGWNVILND